MSTPACPDCDAPYTGRPAKRKAGRVCSACGHAFLLSPDGTTESIQKRHEEEPEEDEQSEDASTESPDQTTEDSPADTQVSGHALNAEAQAMAAAATSPGDPAFTVPEPGQVPGMPMGQNFPGAVPMGASQSYDAGMGAQMPPAMGGQVPGPGVHGGEAEVDSPKPSPKRSGFTVVIAVMMFVVGAGLGVGTQFVPALDLNPPPPPPPPEPKVEPKPAPKPPPPLQARFIETEQTLWSGPDSEGAYQEVTVLPEGSTVFATAAQVASFTLVHDAMGRTGFVLSSSLVEKRPTAPLTDCGRAPFESEDDCSKRIQGQLKACTSGCPDEDCKSNCQEEAASCEEGCAELGLESPDARTGKKARKKGKGKRKRKKAKGRRGRRKGRSSDSGVPDLPMPDLIPE